MSQDPEESGRPGSRRVGAIWLLVVLSFVPAIVVRMLPGGWQELHPAAQWITMAFAAACTLAVGYLLVKSAREDA
jgi:hypothetical protein